jgi:branched-chain amino acid transport system permease protein
MPTVKQDRNSKPFPPSFHSGEKLKTRYEEDLSLFQTAWGRRFMVLGLICLFGLVPCVASDLILHLINMVCIYAVAAVGLNLMTGYTGQLSLGHGAFFGIGAYTSAILAARADFPLFLTIPIAGIAASFAGSVFAIPSLRLKPIFLPMATLAGQFMVDYLLRHWVSLTGGSAGLAVPKPALWGLRLGTDLSLFYVAAGFLVLVLWLTKNLLRSKIGRAFSAIRQNERTAAATGIAVFPHKLFAFVISSFLAGTAGALFAHVNQTITPGLFDLTLSIEFLAVIILGGLGSISGSIMGALAIVLLKEILAFLSACKPVPA